MVLPDTQVPELTLAARPLAHKKVSVVTAKKGLDIATLEQFPPLATVPTVVQVSPVHHCPAGQGTPPERTDVHLAPLARGA